MTLVRRLARPLLAASFVADGLDAVRHPAQRVEAARPLVRQVAAPLGLPTDPEALVRVNGAAMAAAGALFGLGRLPRLSALVMALTLAPAAYTQHAFWQEKDPVRRRDQRRALLHDVSLVGAALVAAVDTAGRPGLAWRSRRAVRQARRTARTTARSTAASARSTAATARAALPG